MPKLGASQALVTHKTGHFGFSAVKMTDLGASEYTLVTIVCDRSGSTAYFQGQMEAALKTIYAACNNKLNARRDNLLVRVLAFDDQCNEVHGFKLLNQINANDYDGCLRPGGLTCLYDACIDGIEAVTKYGEHLLKDEDITTNAIVIVITDGLENRSTLAPERPGNILPDPKHVVDAMKKAISGEFIESLLSILIAVKAGPDAEAALDQFNQEVGFSQFVAIQDADEKTLMKLAAFVSKSISSQSQHLGSGGPSKPIVF
jgi:hypothetical protein